jgi:hypothetical protein
MKWHYNKGILISACLILMSFSSAYSQDIQKLNRIAMDRLKKWQSPFSEWRHLGKVKADSVSFAGSKDYMRVYFSRPLSYYPVREDSYSVFIQSVKNALGKKFRKYRVEAFTNGFSLVQLIPNLYRIQIPVDSTRIGSLKKERPVLVKNIDRTIAYNGLNGNSIALWHSHGYYYEMKLDRWEWQRARLFGTVEDISVMGYVLPYLSKMLENAGANLFLPRERDTQTSEIIVDNDKSDGKSEVVIHLNNNTDKIGEGFLKTDTLFTGENPFKRGTSLRILNDSALYVPEIPSDGEYAVYVSYPRRDDNSRSVRYIVNHSGGKTRFIVDQTIGGETWIYLGTFHFKKGKDTRIGSVMVAGTGETERYIALDAVRFGGGMGNVARKPSVAIIKNQLSANDKALPEVVADSANKARFSWKLSGKPRYVEASRYWLQYAGMPDSLVYSPNYNMNDYNDDYMSRGRWVNYLSANPQGKGSGQVGLGIPIDVSFAFHTDAGVTPDDSIIGTLAIYSTASDKGKFPDGTSRMASRDISDIIQTQVVGDIRKLFDPDWTRRGMWDSPYYEARVPNVPATLLELLSHQNKADQNFGVDPRFRYAVSRAIYKGILKYQAYVEKRSYVVEPVPVTDFALAPVSGRTIRLSWEPGTDTLEPTSKPDKYRIYKRTADNGFDNGTVVETNRFDMELENYDTIYSFKVTALNSGGESFESEILSVGIKKGDKNPVLVVNGFDRISGPAWFDRDKMAGVAWWQDRGVADHTEISNVGDQYDFDRNSAWQDDDSPGWGASYGDMEGKIIKGNSFDYPYIHGKSILAAGHSFYSVSDEYFTSARLDLKSFRTFDLIFGEERSIPWFNDTSRIDYKIYTPSFIGRIKEAVSSGANILMTGSYVGTDLLPAGDSTAIRFARDYLHFLPRTGHAVRNGNVYATDYAKPYFSGSLNFNTGYSENIYSAEFPDAIEPAGKGAACAFRYSENNTSAGISFRGKNRTVVLGFPFETILNESHRNLLMKQIMDFFEK